MICPECKAEYREGFTRCADCDVELVRELPKDAIEMRKIGEDGPFRVAGNPGDPNEDPFCSFWKGNDARVHVELCGVLDDAGIAHNTVFRRDHLFNLSNYAAYEVGVPFSMYEQAEKVVKEAYGTEEVADVGAQEVHLLTDRSARGMRRLPETLTPSAEEEIPGPPNAAEEGDWFPEDATIRVWSTDQEESPDFLVAALHENKIRCRVAKNGRRAELYVLPGDEKRAKELVREVVEGQPPD